jgi:hypothetical protein
MGGAFLLHLDACLKRSDMTNLLVRGLSSNPGEHLLSFEPAVSCTIHQDGLKALLRRLFRKAEIV